MDNRKYHIEMMLIELRNFKFPNFEPPHKGDTRNYLSVDMGERNILTILLQAELDAIDKR